VPNLRHDFASRIVYFIDDAFPAGQGFFPMECRRVWNGIGDWMIDEGAFGDDESAAALRP